MIIIRSPAVTSRPQNPGSEAAPLFGAVIESPEIVIRTDGPGLLEERYDA